MTLPEDSVVIRIEGSLLQKELECIIIIGIMITAKIKNIACGNEDINSNRIKTRHYLSQAAAAHPAATD